MLILLSPAKTLDFAPTERDLPASKPALHAEAKRLAAECRRLTPEQIAKLMSVSDALADTAHGYFQNWKQKWDARGAKQAILAFRGDVYQGLDADSLSDKRLEAAQHSVRILSGLYGVLRPLDLIQAYRLEMGSRLKTNRGANLYAWWGDRVTTRLNAELAEAPAGGGGPLVVNLASKEYASVVDVDRLEARVVTPEFKDKKGDRYRVISFFAKRARGAMARHLVTTRKSGNAALRAFDASGYRYDAGMSTPERPVFTRDAPPAG